MRVYTKTTQTRLSPRDRRGISLLEVILAMSILLISIAAIGQLVDRGSNDALDSLNQATGTRLAISKLAELEAGVLPVSESSSGTFTNEPAWRYTIESTPSEFPNLYTVTVKAERDRPGRIASIAITQMIYDPSVMGNASEAVKPTTTTGSEP